MSIGQNTCLEEITFECNTEFMGGDFVDFLCGLRLNRSIKKVSSPIYDATFTLTPKIFSTC